MEIGSAYELVVEPRSPEVFGDLPWAAETAAHFEFQRWSLLTASITDPETGEEVPDPAAVPGAESVQMTARFPQTAVGEMAAKALAAALGIKYGRCAGGPFSNSYTVNVTLPLPAPDPKEGAAAA